MTVDVGGRRVCKARNGVRDLWRHKVRRPSATLQRGGHPRHGLGWWCGFPASRAQNSARNRCVECGSCSHFPRAAAAALQNVAAPQTVCHFSIRNADLRHPCVTDCR